MRFLERGIKVCHEPPVWHGSSGLDVYNSRRVKICLQHWHTFGRTKLRHMATGGPALQEDPARLKDLRETDLYTGTSSIRRKETSSSAKLPVPQSTLRLRYVRTKGETLWLSRSSVNGRMAYISRRSIRRRFRRRAVNPLAEWLDSRPWSNRAVIWAKESEKHLNESRNFSLPTILLFYLEGMETSVSERASLATTLDASAFPTLQKSGFSPEDVHLWAHILTAPTDEEVAQRYLSCQCRTPTFVLLEILRRPRLSVSSFRSLLVHSYYLTGIRATSLLSETGMKAIDIVPAGQALPLPPLEPSTGHDVRLLENTTFEILACRLLRHARQVWPSAIVTISNMVVSYCQRLVGDELDMSPRVYARLCKIYNMMLLRLSLPASVNPMKSMRHNWQAQRILLISAATFRPPLQLDKSTYRAVSRVLLASKKSSGEKRYASLMQRTWPPWRKELDGMDVNRSPDEDISRVVAALSRMREAGYAEDAIDRALKILGGREPDGTPAIQTRHLTKIRRRHLIRTRHVRVHQDSEDITVEWAARISATRDIYEAWGAFQGFTRDGQRPSHSMYHAMFEKLIYRALTDALPQGRDALAGDAKEALPVMDDNLSENEKLRMQPPSLDALFSRMIGDSIRPSGRCLEMLISNAPTLEKVALYMHHGALPSNTLIDLLRKPMDIRFSTLRPIPDGIFTAFIRFLCRSRRRRITDPSDDVGQKKSVARFKLYSDPIIHAFELVRRRQSSSRVVWYLIFRALARREFIFDENRDQHINDVTSWRLLEAALGESRKAGVQLDSDGFRQICIGLEKALLALPHVSGRTASYVRNGPKLVKEIFANLTESKEAGYALPRLLHTFVGYHLHPYIRVLGHTKDIYEVMIVLQWMVKHQEELSTGAKQSRNGPKLLRRSLIAIKAFFGWKHAEEEVANGLKAVMDQLDGWGGWPTDDEAEDYLAYEDVSEPLDETGAQKRYGKTSHR
jgi:hypothetical protein